MGFARRVKRLLPPALTDALESIAGRGLRFSGPYAGWEAAAGRCGGYAAEAILARVADATQRVLAGEAAYERDGVLFDRIEYSYPLLALLLKAAGEKAGRLAVLDFGGSLGSSYRECRTFLANAVAAVQWSVVEQPAFAREGRARFESGELRFFGSVAEALAPGAPDVLLLSSVLQYLRDPARALDELLAAGARYVAVDRTIVNSSAHDRLYVQHVPASIYAASYPCWSLSEPRLLERFSGRYDLLSGFASLPFPALRRIGSEFKGYLFARRP
jgi:putative methyltransferase (TIGR04325 family)